jgi:cytochrome c biogenesis protein ResB
MRKPNDMRKWEQFFEVMGNVAQDRAEARAEAEGQELTERMQQPGRSVSAKAGRMERESPLFFGTGENPGLFN